MMPAPLRRWNLLVAGAGILAIAGIWAATERTEGRIRTEVACRAAEGAAGYLSLVVPADTAGRYDGPRLLSAASLVATSSFWNAGLQVASDATPLLADPAGWAGPDADVRTRLAEGARCVSVARAGAPVTVVAPLHDPDLWDVRGWVAVWNAVPSSGVPVVRLLLTLAALLALGLALPVRPRGAARFGGIPAWVVLWLGLLALVSALELRTTARAATDISLARGRRLIEVASVAGRRGWAEYERMVPGLALDLADSLTTDRAVRRSVVDGAQEAAVSGVAGGTRAFRLSMPPYAGRLGGAGAAYAACLLLFVAAAAFAAWAAEAGADRRRFRTVLTAWGFLAPAAAHLAVFSAGPLLFAVWLSVHRWGLVEPSHPWVGFANFHTVLTDPAFWHSIRVTAVYALYVPATLALALGAAVLLDRSGLRVRVLRTLMFVPFISSVVAVALVWQWIYQPDFGPLNQLLALVGIRGPDWLGDPRTALGALMLVAVWVHVGYQMVILLAGLQAIPEAYHDAARVDGAGPWRRFWHVTLPLLRPTILFVVVTGTIASFQVFTFVSVLTEGGPLHATDVIVYRIYQEGWEFLRFGTASAMSLLLALVLGVLAWIEFRWLGRHVELA